ncbi:MAG: DoxX protein [Flavobacteriaceae bacterium CG_4_8_14_3_um_filter_34_10]|nr:MAG: hypothetical protein AUK33_11190 [Flavobacteriaceae bacterium CG2_30_34_30]PIQ19592.1 MAG: DoxX protein [Flavobacteriaceae bacterium CG18_big_fil_WC_8_21_14_2_50_34_36]PIX10174.1 MAG: DoxX protein [Flavobacteriaceae bacterium CG_4_8_14_3_um_filter_34_10]PJC08248.1 MAG: DoxX protein [Flavobacteriaceae bacterium CG_4_9_14_0_8_um_filter_34_30]
MNTKISLISRILLGLALIIFGANKFFNFMPPMEMPEAAQNFMGALMATGYMFPLIALVEIIAGLLLLFNAKVSFALLILAPLVVNILLFHLVLDIKNILPGAIVAILTVILYIAHWDKFKSHV